LFFNIILGKKKLTFNAEQVYLGAGLARDVKFNENVVLSLISIIFAGGFIISGAT
jgi:hypothetical protein